MNNKIFERNGIYLNTFQPKKSKSICLVTNESGFGFYISKGKDCKSNLNHVYNKCKYPVDMVNKMSNFYKIPFKNTRCTISMFKNMIELCMTNTYNGYSDEINSKLSHGDYLMMFGSISLY